MPSPSATSVDEAGQVEPAEPRAPGLGDRAAQQVVEDLDLAALAVRLELDLAAQRAADHVGVADPRPPRVRTPSARRSAPRGAAPPPPRSRPPRSRTGPRRRSAGRPPATRAPRG